MALTTVADVVLLIPALSGAGEDTVITALALQVSAHIAIYCGYPAYSAGSDPSMESQTYTLYLDGPADPDHVEGKRVLRLGLRPVQSVTSISDDSTWSYTSLVASTDYVLDSDKGEIWLSPVGTKGAWTQGKRNIKAVVVAGFSTVPTSLKNAASQLVKHYYHLRASQGISGDQRGGGINYRPEEWPQFIKQELARYRLPSCFIGGV